jgi:hypothetical protein
MSRIVPGGLHAQLRKKAQGYGVVIAELKPHSREIAQRMIANGELVAAKNGVYRLNELRAGK